MTESQIQGIIEKIVYKNESGTWGIIVVKGIKLKGYGKFQVGQELNAQIRLTNDEKWGQQWRIEKIISLAFPSSSSTTGGLVSFIASNVRGVGKKLAQEFVNEFETEEEAVEYLNACEQACRRDMKWTEPENYFDSIKGRLFSVIGVDKKVTGFGENRLILLIKTWIDKSSERMRIQEIMIRFGKYLSYQECVRIIEHEGIPRGQSALEYFIKNPYELLQLFPKKNFYTMDQIIQGALSIDSKDPKRLKAGMNIIASAAIGFCIPKAIFLTECKKLLGESVDLLLNSSIEDIIFEQNDMIYSRKLWIMESQIVSKILAMLKRGIRPLVSAINAKQLAEEQKKAISMALSNQVSIINGKAGTGKTTVIKYICQELSPEEREKELKTTEFGFILSTINKRKREASNSKKIHLLAPTGKAATRISEKTGIQALTIHKCVHDFYQIEGTVIIDEAGMVDGDVFALLMERITPDCRFILIGDVQQLCPVGRGRIFHDLIESKQIPVTTLTQIHRQKQGGILHNASIICSGGSVADLRPDGQEFCYLKDENRCEKACEFMKEFQEDGQVICPMKSTSSRLNKMLRPILNPVKNYTKEIREADDKTLYFSDGGETKDTVVWRLKDRVICTSNIYELKKPDTFEPAYKKRKGELHMVVANGEQGVITHLGYDEEEDKYFIMIFFPLTSRTKKFTYDPEGPSHWGCIELAYAITVHKSQGSEYKDVIFVIDSETHDSLLNRNLFYTGVTRATRRVILMAPEESVTKSMKTVERAEGMWSLLRERLELLSHTSNKWHQT